MNMPASDVSYAWVEGFSALNDLKHEWQLLCDSTGADIYTTPGWLVTWWGHFGQARTLRTLTARDPSGSLIGLLPFMIETVWAGPVPCKVARLAATDPHTVIFNLPVQPEIINDMMATSFSGLLEDGGKIDLISFTPASEMSQLPGATRGALENDTGDRLTIIDEQIASHTVFQLPESFDDYLLKLSKKRRNQYRRDLKRLKADYDLTAELSHPSSQEIDDFIAFHNQQWQQTGKGGHFCDWKGSAGFYRDLADHEQSKNSVCLDNLKSNSDIIASQFGLVCGSTCHWRLPARSMDTALNQLSIGKIGLILMIERLIASGVRRIEAGVGDYGYKLVYGGESVPVHRLIISRNTASSRAKRDILLAWARALHVGYYRAWFGIGAVKLRDHVPLPHRPLWQSWVRSRI